MSFGSTFSEQSSGFKSDLLDIGGCTTDIDGGPEDSIPDPSTRPWDGNGNLIKEQDMVEPIAVIGLGLKFPQEATSPDAFWQMLVEGRSALTDIPKDRFNLDAFWKESPEAQGTVWGLTQVALVSSKLAD